MNDLSWLSDEVKTECDNAPLYILSYTQYEYDRVILIYSKGDRGTRTYIWEFYGKANTLFIQEMQALNGASKLVRLMLTAEGKRATSFLCGLVSVQYVCQVESTPTRHEIHVEFLEPRL